MGIRPSLDANRKLADYTMALDLMGNLTGIMSEERVIENILELFDSICSPAGLVYIPFIDGKPGKMHSRYPSFVVGDPARDHLVHFQEDSAWTNSGKGFILRISHGNEKIGVLQIDGIAFPQYKKHYLNLALTLVRVFDLAISNARNYRRLEKSKELLRKERDKAKTYLDIAGVILLVIDADEKVSLINKKGAEVLGYKAEEIAGKNWFDHFLPQDIRDEVRTAFKRLMDEDAEAAEFFENPVLTQTGKERLIAWHNAILRDENGVIIATLSSGEDITERKRLEQEFLKVQKLESLGRVAGGIAHDFNNLLTSIMGNITLAKMRAGAGNEVSDLLKEAETSCRQASELTRRFLTFSKGGRPIKKTGSIAQVIRDAISLTLTGADVRLEFSISEDLLMVEFDVSQMEQVMTNLLVNAREAMPEGGGIKVSAKNISIETEDRVPEIPLADGKYVKISIQDQGPGIPEENLPNLFDPYFSTKERGTQKGMGLGLSTAYSIIKKHEGHIHVESKAGAGTTVHIYLPAIASA